jgi:aspartate oxidase
MGLIPVKTTASNGVVVFQRIDTVLQGGASLDATGLTAGDTLAAGTAIIVDEATRKATVVDADTDTPTGLLASDVTIADDAEVVVVLEGVVYKRRISHAASKTSAIIAKLPRITFSNSF